MGGPLLVIDGDSFAHRAYHALPKTIRRRGNKGAGAIVGFANYLMRFYETERPRAVLVAWDTLEAPTYRHNALPGYQGGREFDDELVDQLEVLPQLVTACGFACAKAPGYEADDFLAAAVAREERRGGTAIVATGDRDAYQLASDHTTILQPVRAGELARIGPAEVQARYGIAPQQVPDFIALRGDSSGTAFRVWPAWGLRAPPPCCVDTVRLKVPSRLDDLQPKPRCCASIGRSPPWINRRHCRHCAAGNPPGERPRILPAIGS